MSDQANLEIRDALAKLDPKNNDHWTEQGAPRLDALELATKPARAEVTAAAPLFSRTNLVLPEAAPAVPPVEEKPVVDEDAANEAQLAQLRDEIQLAQIDVDDAQKNIADAQTRFHDAQRRHDELVVKLEKSRPAHDNMIAIQAVLKRQTQEREERAKVASQARELGITAALLEHRSRLDASMGRQNKQGAVRPQFNPR